MKTVTQIKAQIRRCQSLASELGKDFDESSKRIKTAINNVCMAQYGFPAHSRELGRYLAKHPELH